MCELTKQILLELGRARISHVILRSGALGLLAWLLLVSVLVVGAIAAVRRRADSAYWPLAHIQFSVFLFFNIFAKSFMPCLCLSPWVHTPQLAADAVISLLLEISLLLLGGLVIVFRTRKWPRPKVLPSLAIIALLLDTAIVWAFRLATYPNN